MVDLINLIDETKDETVLDRALRPKCFDDYIGQQELVDKLRISIEASIDRNEPLDSLFLTGPSGLGKSTIATIISKESGCNCRIVTAPSIRSIADLMELLTKVKKRDIIFIDEIHRLDIKIGEMLYQAMEDYKVDIRLGNKEIVQVKVNPFCLIGATTLAGRVPAPLRDRFGICYTMQFYSPDELALIARANIHKLGLEIVEDSAILNIARRSRGIPRFTNRLLRRIRDYAQVMNQNRIDNDVVDLALELEGIDEMGLSEIDKKYLSVLYKIFGCGPTGVEAIASCCGEDKITISDYVESYLVRIGFVARTQRGRILTAAGMKYVLENLNE